MLNQDNNDGGRQLRNEGPDDVGVDLGDGSMGESC